MGLLASLFGRREPARVEHLGDRVWLTHDAKINGIAVDVRNRIDSGTAAVLVVAHFADVFEELTQQASSWDTGLPTSVVSADNLQRDFGERLRLDESVVIDLVVAERHPLPSEDDAIGHFLEQLPCRCRLGYHLSLDDPVLSRFAGPSVRMILDSMGIKPTESIESPLVSRRIRAAQKKIAQQASGNEPAANSDAWFERNLG